MNFYQRLLQMVRNPRNPHIGQGREIMQFPEGAQVHPPEVFNMNDMPLPPEMMSGHLGVSGSPNLERIGRMMAMRAKSPGQRPMVPGLDVPLTTDEAGVPMDRFGVQTQGGPYGLFNYQGDEPLDYRSPRMSRRRSRKVY